MTMMYVIYDVSVSFFSGSLLAHCIFMVTVINVPARPRRLGCPLYRYPNQSSHILYEISCPRKDWSRHFLATRNGRTFHDNIKVFFSYSHKLCMHYPGGGGEGVLPMMTSVLCSAV